MATFEESNRVKLEEVAALEEFGDLVDVQVVRANTSYVVQAIYKSLKVDIGEPIWIGNVRVVPIVEPVEATKTVENKELKVEPKAKTVRQNKPDEGEQESTPI